MTREEAIEVLNTYDMSEDNDDTEFKSAIALAMKALEQEPCEDCVSIQTVLDMAEDMTDQFGNKHRVVTEGLISMLPSVTPKLRMVENPCVECGCNYCTNDDCENRYIVDIAESENKE